MKHPEDPISLFSTWWEEERTRSQVRIPTAVCLSTIGIDGFPNARFVSFKAVVEDSLVITGPVDSRKGKEIEANKNVALTFWWKETERQVRVQGWATPISDLLADRYFQERDRYSQAVSSLCEQGKETDDLAKLEKEVLETVSRKEAIHRPKNWGGFSIEPVRIEFMQFRETRFHDRKLYQREQSTWTLTQIQP